MPQPLARFLCTGDLHLGRYPTRLEKRKEELSVDAVWQDAVQYAIHQEVDGVILSGDVVDFENRYYEAFGPLQRGLEQLFSADIEVYAVSGNHDFDVFPRLADNLADPRFHFLGRGGTWETITVEKHGDAIARIAGWSFPQNVVSESPFKTFVVEKSDLPLIGVLHGDLDQTTSAYAPIQRSGLLETRAAGWVLGHIHRPMLARESGMPIVYVGSLQPLDPGEPGAHGPWMMELSSEGRASFEHIPLATLRYQHLSVDASKIADRSSFDDAITGQITDDVRSIVENTSRLKRVVYRVELTGRTNIQPKLEEFALQIRDSALEIRVQDAVATIDTITFSTTPEHDLDTLAKEAGPPAVIARLLLKLENEETLDGYEPLLQDIKRSINKVNSANAYQPLRAQGKAFQPNEEALRALLQRQGMNLLDQLMHQKDEGAHE